MSNLIDDKQKGLITEYLKFKIMNAFDSLDWSEIVEIIENDVFVKIEYNREIKLDILISQMVSEIISESIKKEEKVNEN